MKKLLHKRKSGEFSQRLLEQRASANNNVELGNRAPGNPQPRAFYINASASKQNTVNQYQPPITEQHTGQFDPSQSNTSYSQMHDDNASLASGSGRSDYLPPTTHTPVVEGYTWDMCIVVPNPDHDENKDKITANENRVSYEDIVERLYLAKLQTFCYKSGDGDEIFIKIRAPLERLQEHATLTGMTMLMDPSYLKKFIDNRSQPIADDPDQTNLTPYQFIYGPYNPGKSVICSSLIIYY